MTLLSRLLIHSRACRGNVDGVFSSYFAWRCVVVGVVWVGRHFCCSSASRVACCRQALSVCVSSSCFIVGVSLSDAGSAPWSIVQGQLRITV